VDRSAAISVSRVVTAGVRGKLGSTNRFLRGHDSAGHKRALSIRVTRLSQQLSPPHGEWRWLRRGGVGWRSRSVRAAPVVYRRRRAWVTLCFGDTASGGAALDGGTMQPALERTTADTR